MPRMSGSFSFSIRSLRSIVGNSPSQNWAGRLSNLCLYCSSETWPFLFWTCWSWPKYWTPRWYSMTSKPVLCSGTKWYQAFYSRFGAWSNWLLRARLTVWRLVTTFQYKWWHVKDSTHWNNSSERRLTFQLTSRIYITSRRVSFKICLRIATNRLTPSATKLWSN